MRMKSWSRSFFPYLESGWEKQRRNLLIKHNKKKAASMVGIDFEKRTECQKDFVSNVVEI